MCIDGTRKWEEEQNDGYTPGPAITSLPLTGIMNQFPEIKAVNDSLLSSGIPCIVVAVKKNRKKHIADLHNALCSSGREMESIKLVLYVEHTWIPTISRRRCGVFCNNLDPKRDHILFQRPLSGEDSKFSACMVWMERGKQRRWMTFIATGRILWWQTRRRLIPLTKNGVLWK